MRYEIAPNSTLTLSRLGIRIENPTSVAISVTIDDGGVVVALDPRSQPEMLFSQANDPNSWNPQLGGPIGFEPICAPPRAIEPPPIMRLETATQAVQRQQLQQLEREMQARNEVRRQQRDLEQIRQYQAMVDPVGAEVFGRVAPPPEAEQGRANLRARELLLEHLSPEQQSEFLQTGAFRVKGSTTDLIYQIERTGRVIRLSDQNEFCLQVVGEWVPHFDAMLARKILLECDEPQFLATANNLTHGNPGQFRPVMNERNNREFETERRRLEERYRLNQTGLTERMVAATARLFGAR